jgi:predicted esterase
MAIFGPEAPCQAQPHTDSLFIMKSATLRRSGLPALMVLVALGCGEGNPDTTNGAAGQGGATSPSGEAGASGGGTAGAGTGAVGGAGTGGAGAGGAGAGGTGNALEPDPAFLPKATGPCPDFKEGKITVTPDGKARDVQIWVSDAATTLDGPLIFYWHGTGGSPVNQPPNAIGASNIKAITDKGGIVAAPFHDPAAGTFPWFLTTGSGAEDDLRVADEVLACAIEKVGIDLRHIHSMGMSAGGLHTTQMSYRRSGYLASVVTYSGGKIGDPPNQDPSNKFAAMIFHGGMGDQVVIDFQPISEAYRDDLKGMGHFAFICDHGMGHKIPVDAVDSVHQFLEDHPFGTAPSPYEGGLPAGFPAYCKL